MLKHHKLSKNLDIKQIHFKFCHVLYFFFFFLVNNLAFFETGVLDNMRFIRVNIEVKVENYTFCSQIHHSQRIKKAQPRF